MTDRKHDQRQALIWIGIAILISIALYQLSDVLTPFLFAAILAYILNPGVDLLQRNGVRRWMGVMLMLLMLLTIAFLLLLIIVPVFQAEIIELQRKLPEVLERLNVYLAPWLKQMFNLEIDFTTSSLRQLISEHWGTGDIVSTVMSSLRVGGLKVLALLANIALVPIVVFYLLLDWHSLIKRIEGGIPRRWHSEICTMAREIDELLSQFLRGQLSVMVLLALFYSIGLTIIGLDVALPVGLFTGLLAFVPYLGFAVGIVLATLAATLQFGSLYGLLAVGGVYALGQFVETYGLTPYLVGERIGLHPLAVIFALLAFGQVFGFFGVLLALPASAALLVGLRRVKAIYLESNFYRTPAETLVKRHDESDDTL